MFKKVLAFALVLCLLTCCVSVAASTRIKYESIGQLMKETDVDCESLVISKLIGMEIADKVCSAILCTLLFSAISEDKDSINLADISTIELGSNTDDLQFRINKDYVISYDGTYITISTNDTDFESAGDISYDIFLQTLQDSAKSFGIW